MPPETVADVGKHVAPEGHFVVTLVLDDTGSSDTQRKDEGFQSFASASNISSIPAARAPEKGVNDKHTRRVPIEDPA